MEPPPAPISIISMVGTEMGIPLPFLKRAVRAVSKVLAVRGEQSSIRAILAVVPPMSNETIRSRRWVRARWAAKIAPPAGPDSISLTGKAAAASALIRPPPEWISSSGQPAPIRRSSDSSRCR